MPNRPPMSSDDEDYDGFSFGNEFDKSSWQRIQNQWLLNKQKEDDEHDRILLSIKEGNLDGLKQELLIKYGHEARIKYDAYLKDGWTILLHAVASLQRHIVEFLIAKGANLNCEAGRAEQCETFKDLAPTIFPGHEIGMRVENCAKKFHTANISLAEFLTIDDAGLQAIGIEFEYQRKRILLGLLKFHGHVFSPKSIELISNKKNKNMFEYYEMYAGYLKHLVMMECGLTYMKKIGGLKNVHKGNVKTMLNDTKSIQTDLASLQKLIQQISIKSPKNPLYIGPAKPQSGKFKNVIIPLLKYSVVIGMGIFVSWKIINLIKK